MDLKDALDLALTVEYVGRRGRSRQDAWDGFVGDLAKTLNGEPATFTLDLLNGYATKHDTPTWKSLTQAQGRINEVSKTFDLGIRARTRRTEDERGDTVEGREGRFFLEVIKEEEPKAQEPA